MVFVIESLLTGRVQNLVRGESSAIAKGAVKGPRAVLFLGIDGDERADLSVHGGPDKAIHHYPRDHYAYWQDKLGRMPLLEQAGAFGENISTTGLIEDAACIGDRYRMGTATVEIAQGRQPCWKQAHRLNDPKMIAAMVATRRCGWYYRVIEQGAVAAGDALTLLDRPHLDWTVARVIGLLIAGEGKHDRPAVTALARLERLAKNWRRRAAKLAGL
jgi:MOSC domain-containing protein YiiM